MKRLFVFLLVLICLLVSFLLNTKNHSFSFSQIFTNTAVTTYTKDSINDSSICAGSMYITLLNDTLVDNILGESIVTTYYNEQELCNLLKAKVTKTQQVDNLCIIYAYSPLIPKYVFVNNKKNNLQIVRRANDIIFGWPLILGSI